MPTKNEYDQLSGALVKVAQGIYTNAKTGLKRVRLTSPTPGLVIGKNGNQVLVTIDSGETIITTEHACETT